MKFNLIKGNGLNDERDAMSFIADFKFDFIDLFYILENSDAYQFHAWQGNKLDFNFFYCIKCSFKVSYLKIDDWGNPSSSVKVKHTILKAIKSNLLKIYAGYSNAIKALETGSRFMFILKMSLNQLKEDNIQFEKNKCSFDE